MVASKGNIIVDENKLNKYKTVREIFDKEKDIENLTIDNIVSVFSKELENIKIGEIKKIAKLIFEKNHKSNFFHNDGSKILVSKSGIDESITKILKDKSQYKLLKEHLIIFSMLRYIIE